MVCFDVSEVDKDYDDDDVDDDDDNNNKNNNNNNNNNSLSCLVKYSFFAKMGHPEVKWSIVSSCCLHNRHLLSVSSLKILFLK